jgi:hypothetical protein
MSSIEKIKQIAEELEFKDIAELSEEIINLPLLKTTKEIDE